MLQKKMLINLRKEIKNNKKVHLHLLPLRKLKIRGAERKNNKESQTKAPPNKSKIKKMILKRKRNKMIKKNKRDLQLRKKIKNKIQNKIRGKVGEKANKKRRNRDLLPQKKKRVNKRKKVQQKMIRMK